MGLADGFFPLRMSGTFSLDAAPQGSTLALLLAVLFFLAWLLRSSSEEAPRDKDRAGTSATPQEPAIEGEDDISEEFRSRFGVPPELHEEGVFQPFTGLFWTNMPEPAEFENELCSGKALSMHRATFSKELDKSGKYRYGSYFLGKKRLWEARFQFRFKEPPPLQKDMFFGMEFEQYVPMNGGTKRTFEMFTSMLKHVVGEQVYHSAGDDPAVSTGELETPVFAMPMWAFDQFIVTPEGEEPPALQDESLSSTGSRRFKRVREFRRDMDALEFKAGPTYTFCFWGTSRWMDKLNWVSRMPLVSPIDFNNFCGRPPVHVVFYTLKPPAPGEEHDSRHLASRKNYYFDFAFWSSKARPSRERLRQLLATGERSEDGSAEKRAAWPRTGLGALAANGLRARAPGGRTWPEGIKGCLSCCASR